jgi:chemotaxis protein methyltransferase CheR
VSSAAISEQDFDKFREYFYRKTGILFEASKRYFVDKRLQERMAATDCSQFRHYFMLLRYTGNSDELQTLTNLMTVNETYFFREQYQFKCLVESILPEVGAAGGGRKRPLRIWVLPSSSGEEAYSIAIYLLEHWPDLRHVDVEIIASDIDTRILDQARAGRYSERSVGHLSPALRAKYFRRMGDEYQINDSLRDAVEFTRVNLTEANDTRAYRNMDVVFCRNLLIYFDDVSRKCAAETFYDALNPGGFICLGHSESMSRISSLYKVRKFPQAIVYQKPTERSDEKNPGH